MAVLAKNHDFRGVIDGRNEVSHVTIMIAVISAVLRRGLE
jgi:hypothetical protein